MNDKKLLRGGVIGSVIAAICCFTPFLVVVFAGLGISAWMGWWLDYFLLYPALAFHGDGILLFRRPPQCLAPRKPRWRTRAPAGDG